MNKRFTFMLWAAALLWCVVLLFAAPVNAQEPDGTVRIWFDANPTTLKCWEATNPDITLSPGQHYITTTVSSCAGECTAMEQVAICVDEGVATVRFEGYTVSNQCGGNARFWVTELDHDQLYLYNVSFSGCDTRVREDEYQEIYQSELYEYAYGANVNTWSNNGSRTAELTIEINPQYAINYCPDGTESLTSTVDIPLGSSWSATTTTALDAAKVRYIVTRTTEYAPSYVVGTAWLNGASVEFNQYSVPLSVTVPSSSYGVTGPELALQVDNDGMAASDSDFTLLSACVITATQSPYCANGVEAMLEPVDLDQMQSWRRDDLVTPFDEMAVTAYVENARFEPASYVTANDTTWLVTGDTDGNTSFTVPISPTQFGGIDGPVLDIKIQNAGAYSYTLASVCIVETQQISAPLSCNLYNNDFITSTMGWESPYDGTLSWVAADGSNGAASLDPDGDPFASMRQELLNYEIYLSGAYEISARVRSSSTETNTVTLYAQDPGSQPIYFETYTVTVGTEWTTIAGDFYLQHPTLISVQSDGDELIVDWVCVRDASPADSWRPQIPECVFPSFDDHPEFSILDLFYADPNSNWFWWFALKIGDLSEWLSCEIFRIAMLAVSMILDALEEIGIPTLPDDVTLGSMLRWFRETVKAIMAWFASSITNLLFSGRSFGEWLADQFINIATWFRDEVVLGLVEWLLDMAVAAGLIGDDAASRLLWMIRNSNVWFRAVWDELVAESDSLILLFREIAIVFLVLFDGVTSSLGQEQALNMGENLGGFALYLWRGVEFINEVVAATPLSAVNLVALGAITWKLGLWTIERFKRMLAYASTSLGR